MKQRHTLRGMTPLLLCGAAFLTMPSASFAQSTQEQPKQPAAQSQPQAPAATQSQAPSSAQPQRDEQKSGASQSGTQNSDPGSGPFVRIDDAELRSEAKRTEVHDRPDTVARNKRTECAIAAAVRDQPADAVPVDHRPTECAAAAGRNRHAAERAAAFGDGSGSRTDGQQHGVTDGSAAHQHQSTRSARRMCSRSAT